MEKNSFENLNISSGSVGGFSGDGHHDDVHFVESEDTGNEEFPEYDNNLQSNLRRRKGKIIASAKETIENGNFFL